MAKGPIVTTEVEAFIASVYQKHLKWKAKEVHNEVSHILHKQDSKLPHGWPSLSTVQKVLATVRKNMKETPVDPQDNPWSMGTLDQYPIPPEAIPVVLRVWKFRFENNASFMIRDAKWVARLSGVIADTQKLSSEVENYALRERMCELIKRPFNSFLEDGELMKIPMIQKYAISQFQLFLIENRADLEQLDYFKNGEGRELLKELFVELDKLKTKGGTK